MIAPKRHEAYAAMLEAAVREAAGDRPVSGFSFFYGSLPGEEPSKNTWPTVHVVVGSREIRHTAPTIRGLIELLLASVQED
jgi:hypothetical protein